MAQIESIVKPDRVLNDFWWKPVAFVQLAWNTHPNIVADLLLICQYLLTNVYGCALTAKVTIPELKRHKGHLLLTGSRAGRAPLKGSVYGATKWAITGYGQNLREELADTGVRVTLIEPGMVDTPFFDTPKPDALTSQDVARSVLYAISQPDHVNVSEILIVPNPIGGE